MAEFIIAYITAAQEEEAAKIARTIVDERLAACVNIVKDIRSIYRWKGKVEDEREALLVVKTRRALFDRMVKRVRELHSYTVPEVIAFPIIAGSDDYLSWLDEETAAR